MDKAEIYRKIYKKTFLKNLLLPVVPAMKSILSVVEYQTLTCTLYASAYSIRARAALQLLK